MNDEGLPDFDGKVVLLDMNAPDAIGGGVVMTYASFKTYGGRLFIEGRIPQVDYVNHKWVSKLQTAVAWEDVTSYIVFESVGDYIDRLRQIKIPFIDRIKNIFTG
jgi:hypothetical protein